MQDVMLLIYTALKNDTTLMNLLGGVNTKKKWHRIYNGSVAPNSDEFPRVTMFEVLNNDDEFADDFAECSEVVARIDVWSECNNIFEIAKQIKKVLKSAFLLCDISFNADMYEEDTKVYHKPINVEIKIDTEVL